MRQIVTLTLLLTFTLSFSQTRLDSLITQLKQRDFDKIFRVKDNIVNTQKEAIPKLIELLKDTTYIKLQNTADLIYPGADKFYGHGWIVNYDIDWVSVRAAWLLEEITFQNFGYSDLQISEEKLMNLHKQNYTSYLETGSHNIDFKNRNPRQQLIIYRLMLADRVSKWWKKEKQSWTRFNALKEALSSNDEKRQSLALNYLREDKTQCYDLTLDKYNLELKPLVIIIKESTGAEAEQAKYLLEDKENYWYKSKQK